MTWKQKSGALLIAVLGGLSHCWAANSPDTCHTLSKHGQQTEAKSCYESLVRSDSAYFRAEGYWGLEQYDQANEEFRIATASRIAILCIRCDGECCCTSDSTTPMRSASSRKRCKETEKCASVFRSRDRERGRL